MAKNLTLFKCLNCAKAEEGSALSQHTESGKKHVEEGESGNETD